MAARGRRKVQSKVVECNLQFDGLVQSSIRARLTAEVLKYLFHQRGQMPLSYEQMKRDMDAEKKVDSEDGLPGRRLPQPLQARRRTLAITALDNIMRTLDDVFNTGHPIMEVLLLFGSTIMSPREVYRIRFPVQCYEGKVLSWTTCRMALFQKLVSTDVFGEAKALKPGTKLSVLVLAPRKSNIPEVGLIAKPMFKLTHRGNHYVFNFDFTGKVINPDLSYADASFDISGIELLDLASPQCSTLDTHSTPVSSREPQTPLSSHPRVRRGVTSCELPGLRSRKYSRLCSVEESPIKTDTPEHGNMDVEQDNTLADSDHVGHDVIKDDVNDVMARTAVMNLTADCPPCPDAALSDLMWFQIPITATGFKDKKSRVVSSTTTTHHRY